MCFSFTNIQKKVKKKKYFCKKNNTNPLKDWC